MLLECVEYDARVQIVFFVVEGAINSQIAHIDSRVIVAVEFRDHHVLSIEGSDAITVFSKSLPCLIVAHFLFCEAGSTRSEWGV